MANSNTNRQAEKKHKKGNPNGVAAFFSRMGKGLATFFTSMKAEIKRIVWPDRKHLIQSTATVLAIIVTAGIILFAVDSILAGILTAVGFYTPAATTSVPAATTAASTVTAETTTGIVTESPAATSAAISEPAATTSGPAAAETTTAAG
jgi:preprotein translocase SecE subunit